MGCGFGLVSIHFTIFGADRVASMDLDGISIGSFNNTTYRGYNTWGEVWQIEKHKF